VFDPCAGGMTTALAAKALNRKFICCELNKEYYDKGLEMLNKEGVI
jgi:DNA modification methylase